MNELESRSDEQLVKSYLAGEQAAFEELCFRYERTISSYARAYNFFGAGVEDLCQEGFVGLFSATVTFDSEKENASSFKTFASTCIRRRILNAVNAERNKLNKSARYVGQIDEGGVGTLITPEEIAIGEENKIEMTERISSKLSRLEKKVFDIYIEGYKYTEIAEMLGLDAKSVDNALSRIKQKIRTVTG